MGIKTPREYRNMEFRDLLVNLCLLFKPTTYVEIGVKHGYTFNQIAQMSVVERAVAVDIFLMPRVYDGDKVQKYEMSSSQFAIEWGKKKNPRIDLLFIDGDHSKDQVEKDFYNLSPFVESYTGLICFHDTYPVKPELIQPGYCDDAWEAIRKIRYSPMMAEMFEILTLPGPWAGLTIMRKVHGNHGWMDRGEGIDGGPVELD